MKKLQIKIILILAFVLAAMPVCHGIERAGQIGQTWSFPLFLKPTHSFDEVTYHFDLAYFLDEQWSAAFSLNAQLGGRQLFYLELGPDFYPLNDVAVLPFITGKFLYTMVPNGDVGWLANVGCEIPLGKSFEVENFKLRVSSGAGQLFFDAGNTFFYELVRLGFVWGF